MRRQVEHFANQARACRHLGSPMYGDLLARLADDLDAGGPTATVLRGHEDDPGPSGLALRLAGSVHRLVLAGSAPELAAYYPTAGGTWSSRRERRPCSPSSRPAATRCARCWTRRRRPTRSAGPPHSSAGCCGWPRGGRCPSGCSRSAPAAGSTSRPTASGSPASAGGVGRPGEPGPLDEAWTGVALPVDGAAAGGRARRLRRQPGRRHHRGRPPHAHVVRLARHDRPARAAGRGASRSRARGRCRSSGWTPRRTSSGSTPAPGHLTVLWHSVMWQYVPPSQQERVTARLEELGAGRERGRAARAPVRRAHPPYPEDEHRFWVCAQTWPGPGERVFLGRMAAHGLPVVWE